MVLFLPPEPHLFKHWSGDVVALVHNYLSILYDYGINLVWT